MENCVKMWQKLSLVFVTSCLLAFLSSCGTDDTPTPDAQRKEAAITATATLPRPTVTEDHTTHNSFKTITTTEEVAQTEEPSKASAQSTSNSITFNIDMHDSYYGNEDTNITDPPVWTAPSNAIIIINLMNHGEENHNWAIVKAGQPVPVPYEEGRESDILLVEPGMVYAHSQTQWVINAPKPGEYEIICTVSGHYPFMKGKLIITE